MNRGAQQSALTAGIGIGILGVLAFILPATPCTLDELAQFDAPTDASLVPLK